MYSKNMGRSRENIKRIDVSNYARYAEHQLTIQLFHRYMNNEPHDVINDMIELLNENAQYNSQKKCSGGVIG